MQYVRDAFYIYLVIINAAAFLLMHVDKEKAKHKKWRIPEATLITVAVLGGSLGEWAGMYIFRHKTRHPKFVIGVPLILFTELGLYLFLRLHS